MDRQHFMRELEFLLSDISEEERQEALSFYENYFDEAGIEHEQEVIYELGDPSRVAAIIKDGLKGKFDENIHVSNDGFSSDYQKNYEVIDADGKEKTKEKKESSHFKNRWSEMDSRDRLILIVLAVFACIPVSAIFFGIFGGLFGLGFSVLGVLLTLIFGLWIITFILHIIAIVLMIVGFAHLFTMPGAGLIYIGIGFVVMGLGTIFAKMAAWFFKDCIPSIANAIADGLGKIFHPRGA